MDQPTLSGQMADEISFQLSDFGKIDSKKYTLYEVLIDPRLDKLSLDERFAIFNDFNEDADRNNYTINRRYALNGAATERDIFDPSVNRVIRMVNFGSNDYLNMTQHPRVISAAMQALETYGAGSGASCVTAGRTKVKSDLEEEIAETFGREKALVYPTGFMTNTGVLSALSAKQRRGYCGYVRSCKHHGTGWRAGTSCSSGTTICVRWKAR